MVEGFFALHRRLHVHAQIFLNLSLADIFRQIGRADG
jgi:hypothetical protein